MEILHIILSTIVSVGIIAIIIQYHYDKKIKKHEIKLERYIALGEELSKLTANVPEYDKLNPLLNGTYFFSSENVVKEVSSFNKLFTRKRKEAESKNIKSFQIKSTDLKPLIIAIRKELDLNNDYIKKEKVSFFKKP